MIQYLTRDNLDVERYDKCIISAHNSRIFAYSWYLDSVAKDWSVLVLDDYRAVMPLPWRKKYHVKYIFLPRWTQQLGIFSETTVDQELIRDFIKYIPSKFKFVEIFFNAENSFSDKHVSTRQNFILSLNKTYSEISRNFSKGRKSDIKRAENNGLAVKETKDVNRIIDLFKSSKGSDVNLPDSDYDRLKLLSDKLLSMNKAKVLEVHKEDNNDIIGGIIFIISNNRITYLFSAVNQVGRDNKAMSLLISRVINEYAESKFIFDFEGSMIKNLASFFKSFGAVEEKYFHFKKFRL